MRIKINNYDLNIGSKIVLISDIHYKNKSDIKKLNIVIEKIRKLKPDFICIPGDIVDDYNISDKNELMNFFKELSYICKVIISLGNHEYYKDRHENIYELDKKLFNCLNDINNVYVLRNESITFNNLNFYGVELPIEHYMIDKESNTSFDKHIKIKTIKDKYNIVLCHSPINIANSKYLNNIDLVLSGHMHGGVTPNILKKLFKGYGLISPLKTLFPKYAYGYKKINDTNIIVSSGINVLPNKFLRNILSTEIIVIK